MLRLTCVLASVLLAVKEVFMREMCDDYVKVDLFLSLPMICEL